LIVPIIAQIEETMARVFRLLFSVLLGAVVLQGCAPQSETAAPPLEVPTSFSEAGSLDVPDRWWTAFDSDRLNALVDTATTTNFTLKTAWQRLRAAQAVVDRESGALFPDLEASGRAEGRGGTEAAFAVGESFELGLSSVYEVDLWGRIRSRVEAERFRAEASRADYQTAALSLSATVVRTWYQLAEARSQRRLVQEQIQTNEKVLRLLENRFETGQIRSVDILRQRQLVESTREQRTVVESRVRVLEHRLAVLLGRSPQTGIENPPAALPDLPSLPEAGVPTDLVRRRPDVRRAHNLLKAADRDLATAISDQYPRLTLSVSGSTVAGGATNLFQTWAYSFAGNLLAPLFRGGALRAEVDRTAAVRTRRLYEYGQTILTAFREVEDALVREKKQRERIQTLEEQVNVAQQAYEQLRTQYFNGAVDYLDVLTALDEVQRLRRDRLSAELALVEDRIALYRALAGAVETDREREN
jgi:NodT family efflux transporter outer membrane factor (OMF) lipoprotein